jgi:hypothetical protein
MLSHRERWRKDVEPLLIPSIQAATLLCDPDGARLFDAVCYLFLPEAK